MFIPRKICLLSALIISQEKKSDSANDRELFQVAVAHRMTTTHCGLLERNLSIDDFV
jgi:hypothetical protein